MTYTYTYVVLDVTSQVYEEIKEKLKAAGYDHAFTDDNLINMHGFALRKEEAEDGQPH